MDESQPNQETPDQQNGSSLRIIVSIAWFTLAAGMFLWLLVSNIPWLWIFQLSAGVVALAAGIETVLRGIWRGTRLGIALFTALALVLWLFL